MLVQLVVMKRRSTGIMGFLVFIITLFVLGNIGYAETLPEQVLVIKSHTFVPSELTVPAGQKFKLIVKNEDTTAAEFESSDLNREKIVAANREITIFIGPLDAGRYKFFDDLHRDTTTGVMIAK